MSAASVLQSFSPSAMPGPVMPMDVAMRFYISHSPPPLRSFLSSYEDLQRATKRSKSISENSKSSKALFVKPLRPCLSSQQEARSIKKRVVFADMKGLSLTAIHVFSKFDDDSAYQSSADDLQFDMSDLEAATKDLKLNSARNCNLSLDFKQPSADYLDFRNRLMQNSVCLENCSLQERSLSGTVKVRNIGFEKSVQLRVTYDSWASFQDVECSFMNNVYGCQDTDTFAFALELPAYVSPQHRVEFCIRFQSQGQSYWDNNDGSNYILKHVGGGGWSGEDLAVPEAARHGCGKHLEAEFDQYGSPRMSSGLFPGWQSWGQVDTTVPYW